MIKKTSAVVTLWRVGFSYMIKSLPGILHLLQRQRIGALNLHASDEPACCSFLLFGLQFWGVGCSVLTWGPGVAGALPASSKAEQVRVVLLIA